MLYHRSSRKAVVLNPTGAMIWSELATPQTTLSLVERLQSRFPAIAGEQVGNDVSAFLRELLSHDLIIAEE